MIIKDFVLFWLILVTTGIECGYGQHEYAFHNQTYIKHKMRFDPTCLKRDRDDRVPKFVSLSQKDENVRIAIDFDIPFLSIPVNRSIGGIMNSMHSAASGLGFQGLQFNYPAMMMIPLFGVGGMLMREINLRLNSSSSNILQQIVDIPNMNVNYFLQNLFKKKKKKKNEDLFWESVEDSDRQFRYRRSEEKKKRVPRFVSLQQTGDGVQIALDFIIPFLTIPVKRSIYNAFSSLQNMTSTFGALQFNYAAVATGAVVAISGLLIQVFNKPEFNDATIDYFNKLLGKKDPRKEDSLWVLNLIDNALKKYDFDAKSCSLKVVCWYIKQSKSNVQTGKANRLEKFVEGFARTDWTIELVANTIIDEGIKAANERRDCSEIYSDCKITQKSIDKVWSYIL